jgi:hypothetical protein
VHIYRLISANTIEENILRKSDQKRQLDWLAIQSGGFNTEMLAKLNLGEFRGFTQSYTVVKGLVAGPVRRGPCADTKPHRDAGTVWVGSYNAVLGPAKHM